MDDFPPFETPFGYLSPSFADDFDNQLEYILSQTSEGVTPLQTVDYQSQYYYTTTPHIPIAIPLQSANEETYNTPAPSQPIMATPLQSANEETYNTPAPSQPIMATPLQTANEETYNTPAPSQPIMATPLQSGNEETYNTPAPSQPIMATPLQSANEETYNTPAPSQPIMATPLQSANEETYNTPAPSQPIMATPLQFIAPSDEFNAVNVDPTQGPIKRGRGRPKGSKNTKPPKKKLKTCPPNNNEVVASFHNDETHNTSLSPLPLVSATDLLAIVPYVDPNDNNNNSLADDDDVAPSIGSIKRGRGRPKGSTSAKTPAKKLKPYDSDNKTVLSCPGFDVMITEEERENGDQELVERVLIRFDAVRRRLEQLNYGKAVLTTASSTFNNMGIRTNKKKRIGPVPGIQVGDIFYFWGEMCLVGLHTVMPAGIDYLLEKDGATECLTTSIVTSVGHYNDKADDLETLVYTGQGGTAKDGKPRDQELTRGNRALEASQKKGNDVRVIRGVFVEELAGDKKRKVYIYDGLYVVSHYWKEKGTSGCEEFKFNLVRKKDQPPGYATWMLAEALRKRGKTDAESRKGLVLEDVSFGHEKLPVPVLNEVDGNDAGLPVDFTYAASSASLSMLAVPNHQSTGCGNNTCQDGQPCVGPTCLCMQRNGGELPYDNRVLISRKQVIYECGDLCYCPLECKNRLTQTGLKIRLEVFMTERCGWGLRSWEPMRAGTFICELVGTPKTRDEIAEDDEYVFDTSRVRKNFTWNYEPELVWEDCYDHVSEAYTLRSEILVSSRWTGNVSRFMNHSCSGNVMWQPVEFEKDCQPCVRIAFFAKRHIPPLTELRYDYGMSCDTGEVDEDGSKIFRGKKICLCGSEKCHGSFE